MSQWIDVSVPLRSRMAHWPGDPPVVIQRVSSIPDGDIANLTAVSMSAHTGTHMDAPLHFVDGGVPIDQMPLEATVGHVRVIAIRNQSVITSEELAEHDLQPAERVLFKTRNSDTCWARSRCFLKNFVHMDEEAGKFLAARRVKTVGVDYLSVGGYKVDGVETHQAILRAGIWVIEGLDLSAVEPGNYDMVCLPLRIEGADGAPARAILRKLTSGN